MNREPNVCLRSRLSCPQLHRLVPWLSCSSYALRWRVGTLARTSTLAGGSQDLSSRLAAPKSLGEAPCQPSGGAGAFTAGATAELLQRIEEQLAEVSGQSRRLHPINLRLDTLTDKMEAAHAAAAAAVRNAMRPRSYGR